MHETQICTRHTSPMRYETPRAQRLAALIRSRSLFRLKQRAVDYFSGKFLSLLTPLAAIALRRRHFDLNGSRYSYYAHSKNATWANERAVELAYVLETVKQCNPTNMLEIGNVLSSYYPGSWTVCDKYEKGPNIINEDVLGLSMQDSFDLIVSISTLEHVGFDETRQDANALPKAIALLRRLLHPNGQIICTLPIGYNPSVDSHLRANSAGFSNIFYLIRLGHTTWREGTSEEAIETQYGHPYRCANAVAICVAKRGLGE